ncbi:MAG: ATP-binding cassette domain-containing protein, partial [Beijerinckiaceae bacterium]
MNEQGQSPPGPPAPAQAPPVAHYGEGSLGAYNLGKSYGGRQVVRDASLAVRRGEAVGLLGPTGAGKTTTFYMI